jgi:3-oxoadipate enol-lactonase
MTSDEEGTVPFAPGCAGKVHFVESGSGAAVVLLHGLGGDIGFWTADAAVWSSRFRVVAIDLRGSGATLGSAGRLTMADLADDVAAVLDHLSIERASVVGFSMGGNVALTFALRHSPRLDRLVLASTFARMNRQARLFLDAVSNVYAQDRSPQQMFELICPWLFSADFLAAPESEAYTTYPDEAGDDQTVEDWQALYQAQREFDVVDRLTEIVAPTLVVAGDRDALVSVEDAQTLVDGIDAASLCILSGAGHLVNLERPDDFRRAVAAFLE